MGKIKVVLFLYVISISSCFLFDNKIKESDRLHLKIIKTNDIEIDWFTYSTVTDMLPHFVVLKKEKALDTICVTSNIADVNLSGSKIIVGFYGSPRLDNEDITLPENSMGYKIEVDTTYDFSTFPWNSYPLK